MRQLFVDSRDRVSGTTTDFTIQLPETLTIEGSSDKGRIDNLRIPVAVPTIQTGKNDTMLVKLGAQTYTIRRPITTGPRVPRRSRDACRPRHPDRGVWSTTSITLP